jgi:hypothetical protein
MNTVMSLAKTVGDDESKYSAWLPSANLIYEITPKLHRWPIAIPPYAGLWKSPYLSLNRWRLIRWRLVGRLPTGRIWVHWIGEYGRSRKTIR